jgi:hypothetical protein
MPARDYSLLHQSDDRNLDSLLLKHHKPMHDFGLLSRIGIDNVGQQPREVTRLDERAEMGVAEICERVSMVGLGETCVRF